MTGGGLSRWCHDQETLRRSGGEQHQLRRLSTATKGQICDDGPAKTTVKAYQTAYAPDCHHTNSGYYTGEGLVETTQRPGRQSTPFCDQSVHRFNCSFCMSIALGEVG